MNDVDSLYPPEMGERPSSQAAVDREDKSAVREIALRRALTFLGILVLLLCLGSTAVTTILIRDRQIERAPITDQISNNTDVILDCTTPGRKCYERSQRQLRSAISELNQFGVLVASCSSGPVEVSYEDVVRCVQARSKDLPPIPSN